MRTLHLLSIITLTILLFGCNKEAVKIDEQQKEDLKIFNGTYTGIFTVQYSTTTKTGTVRLELNNGKHTCSGNNDRIPAGGSGTFSTRNGIITFKDNMAWSADFDHNLVLHGEYKYSFDGKKLIISAAKNNVGQYEYKLDKD